MPFAIHLCLQLILGFTVAKQIHAKYSTWTNPAWLLFLAFQALGLTTVITASFRFYPHWSLFYLTPPADFPAIDDGLFWLTLCAVLFNFGACVLGYSFYYACQKKLLPRLLPVLWILALLQIALLMVLFSKRIFFIGSYEIFQQQQAKFILIHPLGLLTVAYYISALIMIRFLRKI